MTNDLLLQDNGNGGDLVIQGNGLAMTGDVSNQIYLSLFSTLTDDYLGNDLFPKIQSATEKILSNVILNASGRTAIIAAVNKDLAWLVPNYSVSVTIPSPNRADISIIVNGTLYKYCWVEGAGIEVAPPAAYPFMIEIVNADSISHIGTISTYYFGSLDFSLTAGEALQMFVGVCLANFRRDYNYTNTDSMAVMLSQYISTDGSTFGSALFNNQVSPSGGSSGTYTPAGSGANNILKFEINHVPTLEIDLYNIDSVTHIASLQTSYTSATIYSMAASTHETIYGPGAITGSTYDLYIAWYGEDSITRLQGYTSADGGATWTSILNVVLAYHVGGSTTVHGIAIGETNLVKFTMGAI